MSTYRRPSRSATNSRTWTPADNEAYYRRVNLLCGLAADRLDDLLAELEVKTWPSGKVRIGPCPVHGGRRHNAFNLYPDGHTARGIWFCRSRGCEQVFKKDLLGLVRGVLSYRQGWRARGDAELSHRAARDWLCGFLGQSWDGLRPDMAQAQKSRFVAGMGVFSPRVVRQAGTSPAEVAARMVVPSPYFIRRGFRPDTLSRFLVGEPLSAKPDSPMYQRAVVPILCHDGKNVIGYSGRSLFEKCDDCGVWHDPNGCPPSSQLGSALYAKWRHTKFERRETLYGLHLARDAIKETEEVIVVEGPGKVWRLWEAGFANAVAIFGVNLADPQQAMIESLPCGKVTILMDPGEAGAAGAEQIRLRLARSFRLRVVRPPADPADMPADELRAIVSAK